MENQDLLKIDVDAVVRNRLPRYYRFIPKWLIRWLERTICQDDMNGFLAVHGGERDAEFCRSIIAELGVTVDFEGIENLPPADDSRVLFVSNHPLGGLDGMILIDFVESRYGRKPVFVVNDLLTAVKPLEGVFVPINKHGAQSRECAAAVDAAFASDRPMIMFPAGLVSRLGSDGRVCDLEWKKMFVTKGRRSGRTVIPVHFQGENSRFFYNFAKYRKMTGLKFNIEMIYLPRELFRAKGKHFKVAFGKPIDLAAFPAGMTPEQIAREVKAIVYSL